MDSFVPNTTEDNLGMGWYVCVCFSLKGIQIQFKDKIRHLISELHTTHVMSEAPGLSLFASQHLSVHSLQLCWVWGSISGAPIVIHMRVCVKQRVISCKAANFPEASRDREIIFGTSAWLECS